MKKIVILSAFLSPLRSGAEACAEEVPLALAEQFDFTIVTARMRKDLPKRDKLRGMIPVIRVGFGSPFDKWLYPFLAPFAVRGLKPDVVHAILETFAGLALVFCKAPKKILTCQTTNRTFLKGFIVKSPNIVTCISSALAQTIKRFGRHTTIIPNGVDLSALSSARDRLEKVRGRVLFVGRLEKQKGIDTLLKAFAELPSGAELRIVGEGSQEAQLKKLVTDLGITDRVAFVGHVSPEQIAEEYAAAEIFCGLSRSEALGNVFLEAQAAGCAVIGTRVGGIPDSIEHEKTGLLVEPGSVADATIALGRLLGDKNLRNKLVTHAAAHVQKYGWQEIAKRYAELY